MSNLNVNKGKHLTIEDRIFIEYALNEKYALKEIDARLGKDPTTISKEIKRNRVVSSKKSNSEFLTCQNRKDCDKKHICTESCSRLCKKCKTVNCYRVCIDYSSKNS